MPKKHSNAASLTLFHAVVLAGGSGTRLWPLSRQMAPKQFLRLYGDTSLIGHTIGRVMPLSGRQNVLIVSGKSQQAELSAAGLDAYDFLAEPVARNTAPAAALAALRIISRFGDGVMAILPSDHMIKHAPAFRAALKTAGAAALDGAIVTLGIRPTCPETGYGYIEIRSGGRTSAKAVKALRFVEKPSLAVAEKYLRSGRFLWNAGIFVLKASTLLSEFRRHVPAAGPVLDKLAAQAFHGGRVDKKALERLFPLFPSVSLDYGIMEKSDLVLTVPCEMGWSDLGNWRCLHELADKDGNGNALRGDALLEGCKNVLVHADSGLVAVMGMENVAVVESRDAVLVCPLDRAQDLPRITDRLKALKRPELHRHLNVSKTWGAVDLLEAGPGHSVRKISVLPGAELSAEDCAGLRGHLVVASGTARLSGGGRVLKLCAHGAFDAVKNRVSTLKNTGRGPLDIIEIAPFGRGRNT
ncbi:MAG: NTP transferase domain-containing protein [Elusimicrobia bacterium]|nr:NTP transferase domain-containing protein [Elusimicrobiota bacterium]